MNFLESVGMLGFETSSFLWNKTKRAVRDIKNLIGEHDIDCGFRKTGAIMIAKNESDTKYMKKEGKALKKAKIKAEIFSSSDFRKKQNVFPMRKP